MDEDCRLWRASSNRRADGIPTHPTHPAYPTSQAHPTDPGTSDLPAPLTLLDSTVLNGCVRHDAAFGQELPAAAAAGLEPLFVQPQHLGVRCAGGSLADF